MKLFVLSDIHSFYEPMMAALEKNGFDINNKDHHIIVCGDLFDRGPDANKVFTFAEAMSNDNRLHYIWGNHEELLFDCVEEIRNHRGISEHHISNGTFDTVCQISGMNKYDLAYGTYANIEFEEKMAPLLRFLTSNHMTFAEADDYVFVHGWIPCNKYSGKVDENWDSPDANWHGARWINGMQAWHAGARLEGKTIVCGHYHTSWGHSHLHQDRKEFPNKGRKDWRKSFEPFIDEGIIAIDACTAYTEFCNCITLEVKEICIFYEKVL